MEIYGFFAGLVYFFAQRLKYSRGISSFKDKDGEKIDAAVVFA